MARELEGRITRRNNIRGKDITYDDYQVVVLYHNNHEYVVSRGTWNVWLCASFSIVKQEITYIGRLEGLVKYMLNNSTTLFIINNLTFYANYIIDKLDCLYEEAKYNGKYYNIVLKDKNKAIDLIDYKQLCASISYKSICKSIGIEYKDIDVFEKDRDNNYQASEEEIEIASIKAKVLGNFLKPMIDDNLLQGYTIGQCALKQFLNTISSKSKEQLFSLNSKQDEFLRHAYVGGWHYLPADRVNIEFTNVIDYDINSLYPYVMYNKSLPIGEPIYFKGNNLNNYAKLYVGKFKIKASLKKGHVPSLSRRIFSPSALTTIDSEPVFKTLGPETFYLTNVDVEMLRENYDISSMELEEGYYWMGSSNSLFRAYIDKFLAIKEQARREGDEAKVKMAKLFLNSLYGKLGQRGNIYQTNVAIAEFITAYGRQELLKVVNKAQEQGIFLYSHTDSIHVLAPLDIPIGDKLGEWKIEEEFSKATYFSKGVYKGLTSNNESVIKSIGLPRDCRYNITYNNFSFNNNYDVMLSQFDTIANRYLFKKGIYTLREEI